MIELVNVEKSYPLAGGRSWVLRQINLKVQAGDFVSIVGPSGSGKSTLARLLADRTGGALARKRGCQAL